jgi:hypothetical protein
MGDVYLAQANVACVGGARDEIIVQAVVKELQSTSAWIKRAVSDTPLAWVRQLEERLKASGRTHAGLTAAWADEFLRPELLHNVTRAAERNDVLRARGRRFLRRELPSVMRDAIAAANRGGLVKSIPATVEQLHAHQKGRPPSTLRALAKKQQWLQTRDGGAYKRERGKLLGADEAVDSSSDEDQAEMDAMVVDGRASSSGVQARPPPTPGGVRARHPPAAGGGAGRGAGGDAGETAPKRSRGGTRGTR